MINIKTSTIQELVIVRGHPGSGKSTLAAKFKEIGYKNFENDDFFTDENGVYKFDIKFHQEAKDHCVNNVINALKDSNSVVASNTYTKISEMDDIINFAVSNNIPYRIFEMEYEFQNLHDVPDFVMEDKKKNFEKHPSAVIINKNDTYSVK